MTWIGFFEGIETIFVEGAFLPYDILRELEPSSWFGANAVSWFFMIICMGALVYWIGELKKYDATEGSDDKSITAHDYLG